MDVIDFPNEPRRSVGPRVTSTGATVSRSAQRPGMCMHEQLTIGRLTLDLCPDRGETCWLDGAEALDPAEALAHLFGGFDLDAAMPGLHAPGETVLAYTPDGRRGRTAMRALPHGRWIEGAPGLWLTTDGDRLLMSPVDRLLADNLMRGL